MVALPSLLLAESDFFRSLSTTNRERLSGICIPKSLEKREVLFREGDKGRAVYLCGRGSIQLHKTTQNGQETVIKVIKPGELFAETILFEQDQYPVTAVALEPALVYLVPKPQFDCLLEDPDFRNDFLANLMRKLRYLADQVQSLTTRGVEDRLFRFLRERFGETRDIRTSLSKKDVAAAIGTTPETLSRLLQKLKDSGRLELTGKRIRLSP